MVDITIKKSLEHTAFEAICEYYSPPVPFESYKAMNFNSRRLGAGKEKKDISSPATSHSTWRMGTKVSFACWKQTVTWTTPAWRTNLGSLTVLLPWAGKFPRACWLHGVLTLSTLLIHACLRQALWGCSANDQSAKNTCHGLLPPHALFLEIIKAKPSKPNNSA